MHITIIITITEKLIMNYKWEKDCKWEKVTPGKGEAGVPMQRSSFNKQAGLIIASVMAVTNSCPRVFAPSLRLSMQSIINLQLV